jgi:N-acetylglucosaminyldiphosphoundecaprenol N-acetyl-beta-D-mannosaminyltransferase
MAERVRQSLLGTPIDVLDWDAALATITRWSAAHDSRVVCICNVHSVVTARHDAGFAALLAEADLATPDGAPLTWLMRGLGHRGQQRINGPDLMWRYCEQACARGEAIFLFGSTEATLALLQRRLHEAFPGLRIAGAVSPPFRPLSEAEDAAFVAQINASGAGTVWVSLGCPKQERWMAAHRGRIAATMVGVGAGFDYHAGTISRAPRWMQRNGLEWLHRLASEPRRLWRRYLSTNSVFLVAALAQWVRG